MSCLIFSPGLQKLDELIKKLFQNESIDITDDKITWNIANKYYTAKVGLEIFSEFESASQEQSEPRPDIGATVFYVESWGTGVKIQSLAKWKNCVGRQIQGSGDEFPEVVLVVVEKFDNEEIKNQVVEWTLDNGAELVDFSEDYVDGCDGVRCSADSPAKRVIEALQTCPWNSFASKQLSSAADPQVESGEAEIENFETLFAQLSTLKEAAESLPPEERRAFAEKIALSFYASMGGSDSESED